MKYLVFLLFVLSQQFALSQVNRVDNSILKDRFRFNVGVYFPSQTIKVGADGSSPNLNVDFNDAFDIKNNESTFFINFFWRFSKKWILLTEYFGIKNSKKITLGQDIEWKDYTFKKESNVEGGYGLNMYRILVGRVFSKGAKYEFGGGLGVHAMDVNAYIQGQAFINDEDFGFKKSTVNSVIPLPNLGLWYFFAPHPKWALIGRVDWFGIKIGEYSGTLWNLGPSINYQVFDNISIGAGYRYFKATVKMDKPDWNGDFSMSVKGPLINISGNF